MIISKDNIVFYDALITRKDRNRLSSHKSVIIWFTGLSGSGKSTISHLVEKELHRSCCRTFVLDGDNIRHGISSDLGFSDADRKENIRRVGEVAKLMLDAGVIVIVALISPFRKDRDAIKQSLPQGDFFEIYCNIDLKTCELRDVKGMYLLARDGRIRDYTGIDSPYEPPLQPDLAVNTSVESVEESVAKVMNFIKSKGIISQNLLD